ncbi:hypothetical protein MTsPCn9_09860 [Croceitalea sp. MTPC9]|uniref:DUF3108 domain-containing protein n=1 Tax=Croceitalea marina TaxID=1775166 RepID=A0ABW5N3E7_9FLAO|nr:hypothetical protein MTsPCn5_37560 [Croceitalea sp. MTPC5]GMN11407.1 hypothetical protein MTsPCn6_27380 [Croceitalea sp. MTPC6]GMN16050.1 hypothetical protein MTsPCn9_09860 [Croceitalea sp. MTPC9]
MKKIVLFSLFCLISTSTVISQNAINPSNLKIDKAFIFPEKYTMNMFFIVDSQKIPMGKIHTSLVKVNENIAIITKLQMPNQTDGQWIDSTVVNSTNFKPLYHSSKNPQREMVMEFGKKITGYYKDLMTGSKTQILETTIEPFFDSNFYPYLIRLLPLEDEYATAIYMFDYNPKSKIGIMKATILDTKSSEIDFNGKERKIWVVKTTNDISDNKFITTFYIDKTTRQTLKQVTENERGQLVMERTE